MRRNRNSERVRSKNISKKNMSNTELQEVAKKFGRSHGGEINDAIFTGEIEPVLVKFGQVVLDSVKNRLLREFTKPQVFDERVEV